MAPVATRILRPNPCSNLLHAPAHCTGRPRLTQKAFSASVNRAHGLGREVTYQNQTVFPASIRTPARMETRKSMAEVVPELFALCKRVIR